MKRAEQKEPRVLIAFPRDLNRHIANATLYEFQNSVCSFDRATLVELTGASRVSRRLFITTATILRSPRLANTIVPFQDYYNIDHDYEILFLTCANFGQVFSISQVIDRHSRCKKRVCYIAEIWESEMRRSPSALRVLELFDHIFTSAAHAVEMVRSLTGVPCSYLAPATDTLQFCPFGTVGNSDIAVCYIGRRSEITHFALMDWCQTHGLLYFFDSAKAMPKDMMQHRYLLASLVKRTRYFVVNYAKFDHEEITLGHQEVGYRFFEGAAGGAVMVGKAPDTDTYRELFDWPDAVIDMPVDLPDATEFFSDLDRQTGRVRRIRRDNAVNSLLRHDWVHRWEDVLRKVDVPPTLEMSARKRKLAKLAAALGSQFAHSHDGVGNAERTFLKSAEVNSLH
jgi:Glycosyl transferases group 1